MTLYEVILHTHAGDALEGRLLRLTGQVTGRTDEGDRVLTRWIHSCGPASDAPVSVHLSSADGLDVGQWVEVEATWVRGSGAAGLSPARLRMRRHRVLDTPPPRLEDDAGH